MSLSETSSTTLAILGGTGKEGPGLAMRWARAGYRIIIGSRQPEKAQATAAALNAQLNVNLISGMDNNSAFREADICVMTVVWTAHRDFLLSLRDGLVEGAGKGKILVDATARVDFRNPQPPPPPSAARQAQDILGPDVRVVAAFQNVPAHLLKKNLDDPLGIDVLVCADDPVAAQSVIELARAGGMRAFYAGNLDNAAVVEGLTCILINLNQQYGVKTASVNFSGLPE